MVPDEGEAHCRLSSKRWLAVAGALVALAVLTRLTANDAAQQVVASDRSLMGSNRLGPTPLYRSTYADANKITGRILATDEEGNARQLGLGVSVVPVRQLLDRGETYFGLRANTPPPPAYASADDRGDDFTETFMKYQASARMGFVVAPAQVLDRSRNDVLTFDWNGRELPLDYIDQDPRTGLAVFVAPFDDGEAEQFDIDEDVPAVVFTSLLGNPIVVDESWLVVRGDPSIRPATRGFVLARLRSMPSPGSSAELTVGLDQAELGAPVLAPYDDGANRAVIGLTVGPSTRSSTPMVTVDELLPLLRAVASAQADPTDTTPYLGVGGRSAADARILDPNVTTRGRGYLVAEVASDSPAAEAGLQEGDLVVRVDETVVVTATDFLATLRLHSPDDEVVVTVLRGARRIELPTRLESRP